MKFNTLTDYGLMPLSFYDPTDPVTQVYKVLDSGENLDDYHWERFIWNYKWRYTGVKLMKNEEK